MAIDIDGVWRTTAGRDAVWEVVSDLSSWREWWPAIEDVEELEEGGADGVGRVARLAFRTPVRRLPVDVEVIAADAPSRLEVASPGGGIRGNGAIDLAETDGVTEIRYAWQVNIANPLLRFLEPILRSASSGSGRETMRVAGDRLARLAGGEPLHHDV
ncbi:MAG: SRPBCC family protein [Nitriliruptorales bacterium]